MCQSLKKNVFVLLWFLSFLKLYFNFGNFLAIYSSNNTHHQIPISLLFYPDTQMIVYYLLSNNPCIFCFYFIYCYFLLLTSLVAQTVKCLPTIWETWVQSLGWEDLLEKAMATHSSTLALKSQGWRSLVGYSPWGHKELDMTERLHYHFCYVSL